MTKTRRQGDQPADNELQGVDKVTALLLVMGKPLADRIIKQFEDRDIRALARSATELPAIGLDTIDKLIDELGRQLQSSGAVIGSSQEAQDLLAGVVSDEEVSEIMGELSGHRPKRIWARLAGVAEEKLEGFVAAEQPQVAAFVLSNLDVDKASAVMAKLERELRADLSGRLLSLKPIGDGAARLVADRLAQELLGETEVVGGADNHAHLGAILNRLEREQVSDILARLDASHPEDARKVKQHVFNFEDVAALSSEDCARLFDEVPAERTVLALHDCDPSLQATVLAALSPRSRRLVEAELSSNRKLPRKSIVDARRAIAGLALSMAEKSIIRLAADGRERVATNPTSGNGA
jgi:flagellar motor switch protein FliG